MARKKVIVVGAGPGGLTASMLLAGKGYDVEIFEKRSRVGGRNGSLQLEGGYTFDIGPTFLMMLFILEEIFKLAGRDVKDYLDIRRIDPFYRLLFGEKTFYPTSDRASMRDQINRLFPGSTGGYDKYMAYEKKKFARLVPCLRVPYDSLGSYMHPRLLEALPYLDAHYSLYRHLGKFFKHDDLKTAFTFQAKYLGMSPWDCPATFSIISYIEHSGGIHHPIGGLNRISEAMSKVVEEDGGKLHLETPVEEVLVRGGKAVGVRLESGDEAMADHVVINADFAHAMNHLVDPANLDRWAPAKLEKKSFSCSTFMLYLGLDRRYDIPHHNIVFASDYRKNVEEIARTMVLSDEPSIYIQNASVTDSTLAPEGHSAVYVLVPVANNRSGIAWDEVQEAYTEKALDIMEQRAGMEGLRKHIQVMHTITPKDWEQEYDVYRGATFNLGHSIDQMLYFRPHNRFEEFDNCYLVGGGTHPGSGLPTIYESGRISAGLIMKKDAWL